MDGWDMDAASAVSVITVGTPLQTRSAKAKPSVTRDSRAIPQPSTNLAQPCLSSVFKVSLRYVQGGMNGRYGTWMSSVYKHEPLTL